MFSALYSAISGLNANSAAMDVIGNNIANANTTGFKSSRADFAETFYQVSRSSTFNQPVSTQVGLGVQVLSTPTEFTQGGFSTTGVPEDLALNGDGFFVVQSPTSSTIELTRAGDFTLDQNGNLTTQDGYNVKGVAAKTDFPVDLSAGPLININIPKYVDSPTNSELTASYTIDTDGTVTAIGQKGTALTVGYVAVATYPNPNGLTRVEDGRFTYNTAAGATNEAYMAGSGSAATIRQGALELSNVDLAEQFSNMIVTQRGFDANAKTITTTDEMLQTVINSKR